MNNQKTLFLLDKVILGTLMVIFGLNKFLGFIAVNPPDDATAQSFLGSMFTSYLYVVVAFAEIVGGILLFVPRYAFLGSMLLMPVIFNIVAFHLAHDLPGNGIWIVPTVLYAAVLYFFQSKLKTLLLS